MRDKLNKIKELSRQRRQRAEEIRSAGSIKNMTGGRVHVPLRAQSVFWSEDGLVTPLADPEEVGVEFNLPAEVLEWSFKPARYRIFLRTDGTSTIEMTDGQGRTRRRRQVYGRGIFDIPFSVARLTSTKPITDIEMYRFTSRLKGEVVLGPFQSRGIVSAEMTGDGQWSAQVASEPLVPGKVKTDPTPQFVKNPSHPVWRGHPPSENQPSKPDTNFIPWAQARRFSSVDTELEFYETVRAGEVHADHEKRELEKVYTAQADELWWHRLEEWTTLAVNKTPGFDPRPALWTNIWGTADGVEKAWDLETGLTADSSKEGSYLVRSDNIDDVDIEGDWAAEAEPLQEGASVPPGTHGFAKLENAPRRVYVKISGRGQASGVELQSTIKAGPGGLESERIRQIDLSKYFGDDTQRDTSGRGRFLGAE